MIDLSPGPPVGRRYRAPDWRRWNGRLQRRQRDFCATPSAMASHDLRQLLRVIVGVRPCVAARVSPLSPNLFRSTSLPSPLDAKGSAWSALSAGSARHCSPGERWTSSSEGSLTGHAVAAAWLLCICVATLALAVTSGLHDKELPAATVADKAAIGWQARSVCRLPLACAEGDTAIGKPW
jgi:hypothetical protein